MPLTVLGVSGSLRGASCSALAVRMALEAAQDHGAEVRLLDLREIDLPLFRPGHDFAAFAEIRRPVHEADALILATPDYHGSMSGAMKNFLDYFHIEFAGKLFGYICASHEKGLTAMDQMRTAIRQCYGWSLPYGVSLTGGDEDEAALLAPAVANRLVALGRDITVYGNLLRRQFLLDLSGSDPDTFAARYRPPA